MNSQNLRIDFKLYTKEQLLEIYKPNIIANMTQNDKNEYIVEMNKRFYEISDDIEPIQQKEKEMQKLYTGEIKKVENGIKNDQVLESPSYLPLNNLNIHGSGCYYSQK
jgi:hypothetical protein